MKHTLSSLAFLLIFLSTGFSQQLKVMGKINTKDTVKLYISYSNNRTDSATTVNGSYSFNLQLAEPSLIRLVAARKNNMHEQGVRTFFAQSGEVVINASSIKGVSNAPMTISNPSYNDLYKNYRARLNPLVKVARTLIDRSFDSGRTAPEKQLFRDLFKKVNSIETEVMAQFALENTGNIVGAYVFSQMQNETDVTKLDSIYNRFDKRLRTTSYLRRMKEKIRNMKTLAVGKPAPDFMSVTSTGASFKLSDLKGKYVLLDFWGSWCQPCITGMPKMKEYYEKYKNNIEFVGIACNDSDVPWRTAIEKYQLTWPQLLNSREKQDISLLYNVLGFPTKVLIGKDGNFIASFLGEDDPIYLELDKLLQ